MTPRFEQLYMDIAQRISEMSRARRLQVGAVIVRDDRILSMGYNGTPAGWDNNCEDKVYKIDGWQVDDNGCYDLKSKPEVLHAETNAIAKLARSTESGLGATLFVTRAPCLDCAKIIYQSGIKHVYYATDYRDDSGITFLRDSGIQVEKLDV